MDDENSMGQVIQIDEARIRDHLGEMVRGTVENRRHSMIDQAPSLPAAGNANRSRRLIKCAKDSGHYPVGCDAQRGVVMKAAPSASLELPEPNLLLEFLIIALDAPA
jgi:hypothetical protein